MPPTEPTTAFCAATICPHAAAANAASEHAMFWTSAAVGFLLVHAAIAAIRSSEPATEPPGELNRKTTPPTLASSATRRTVWTAASIEVQPHHSAMRRENDAMIGPVMSTTATGPTIEIPPAPQQYSSPVLASALSSGVECGRPDRIRAARAGRAPP